MLTTRESEVLNLITYGYTNREIASELSISEKTAATHRKNIQRKLNAKNTALLVRYALQFGLVKR
jgi:two-component system, NarL family, response regulator NreC